ncbi:hypothetical protein MRB53_021736 [Persea americana]|uniref:Uncharacterized protein n=1 Tax=Persea americana TaxID=3435 RepID=A0ACC2L4S7_PERAE|nr:hypothetical protein MRB53_021736 [Persea americana]
MATSSETPPIVKEQEESMDTIIEEERRQMAAVRRELVEVFKSYEKNAKARLGKLTREAHQAYEDQETDQSKGTPADIQEKMKEKVNEMKELKEDVELCLKYVLKETDESKDSSSKVDRYESQEWKEMDKELEKMLENAAEGDKGEDFDRLPQTFRNCLLCLSIFPVGSEISKRVLIYWWIGEGFVSPTQQKSAEQVGEDYFKQFLDSEFIHPVYHKRSGSIVKCRTHPWIHWMLISKAKESNFFNFDERGTPTSSPSKGHRACLTTNLDDVKEPPYEPDEKLVLLFNINVKYLNLEMEHFSRMKKIVVLQLGRWHASDKHHIEMDDQVLEKLCSLINLRYLSLRGISVIETIPKSIGKLQHLQVLDLRGCQNLKNLTDGITKLRRLTHFDVSECYMLESMPEGLSSLSELLVLKGFVMSERKKTGRLTDLINLVNLKKLSITIGSQVKKNITNQFGELEKMKSISSFTVIWSDLPENTPGYKPHPVHSLKFPPNLEKLDLRFYPINEMPEWLGPKIPPQLQNLKQLYIRGGKLGEEHDGKRETLVLKHSAEAIHPKLDIKVLRLKFLQKLKLKWSEIELPSLDYFEYDQYEKMEDPPLMDVDGVWTRVKETDSDVPPSTTTVTTGAPSSTTTTDATTSQTHHDTITTAPIATNTPTTTTSTSTSDSTISAPSAIIPDAAAATATTATSPSSAGPSSSPTLATTTTTATSPLATPTTGPALTPPTCPTTTTSVSSPTPKVAPSTSDPDDDNEHDEPAHDPSSIASTEAHLIDPHTTSPDGISASGVDSLVDEPTSGTPHVPSHIVPAPTTASVPSSSAPTIVPPNKVDHEDDLEDKSEHDITSSASTAAHAIDPNTASPDDVTVSALGAASMAAEPSSGTPSVPGPANAADATRDSSLSSNPISSSTTTANQPSISTTTPQVN